MSDLISRSKAKEELLSWAVVISKPNLLSREDALAVLDMIPAVDAVEVVRCKDCKRWLKDVAGCSEIVGRCEYANYMVGSNGYCVYGERKYDATD